MADAKIAKQIVAETPNRVGVLAEVTGVVSAAGANIQAISAYGVEKNAIFRLLTDNNQKAISGLKSKGYNVREDNVVAVSLPNKVGTVSLMAKKLKNADIDLKYIYGSTGSAPEALIVFDSNDNAKAVEVLK